MKLTQTQKLHALAYRFYQGAAWTPKAGDFYTTSRADLELYQVVSVEGGIVRTRYTEGSDAISEWQEAGFLTEGFGPKRVFVPEWVMNLKSPPEASNLTEVVDNRHEGADQLNPVFVAHKSSPCEMNHGATNTEQWLSSRIDTAFVQRLREYRPDGHGWFHVTSIDEMQAFYLSRLPAIREAARQLGYAIGLHGSTRRDFDLMAMPWRGDAADRDTLAHAIAKAACGLGREGAYDWTVKPAGRFSTSIPICWKDFEPRVDGQGMIDLSVISAPAAAQQIALNVSLSDKELQELEGAIWQHAAEIIEVRSVDQLGWLYDNEDTGREYSEDHPIESGSVPDATNIVPATAAYLLAELKSAWKAWNEDRAALRLANEQCATAEAESERVRALALDIQKSYIASIGQIDSYALSIFEKAEAARLKAQIKFPQPNYIALKVAEEAGEVVRAAVHYAENRHTWEELEGEVVQTIAMLMRLLIEGDHVNGIRPPSRAGSKGGAA